MPVAAAPATAAACSRRRRKVRRDAGAPESPKPVAYPPNLAAEEYPDVWQNMAYIKSREEYDAMYQRSINVGAQKGRAGDLARQRLGQGWRGRDRRPKPGWAGSVHWPAELSSSVGFA